MDDDTEDDVDEKVIVMHLNRPRPGLTTDPLDLLPSPSEIGDDDRPYGRVAGRGHAAQPEPEEVREPEEQDYSPPPKKSDPLPRPGDAYRACARFLNRLSSPQRLIHFVDKECWAEGYAYSDLRRCRWVKVTARPAAPSSSSGSSRR